MKKYYEVLPLCEARYYPNLFYYLVINFTANNLYKCKFFKTFVDKFMSFHCKKEDNRFKIFYLNENMENFETRKILREFAEIIEKYYEKTGKFIFHAHEQENITIFSREKFVNFVFGFHYREDFFLFINLLKKHIEKHIEHIHDLKIFLPVSFEYKNEKGNVIYGWNNDKKYSIAVHDHNHGKLVFHDLKNEKEYLKFLVKHQGNTVITIQYQNIGDEHVSFFRNEYEQLLKNLNIPVILSDERMSLHMRGLVKHDEL